MSASISTGQLRLLVVLARAGVVANAATELGVSRRNLRQMVRAFEEQVGVSLFVWSRNSVALTEAGGLFIARAQAVLDVLHRVVSRINGSADVLEMLATPPQYVPAADEPAVAARHSGPTLDRAV